MSKQITVRMLEAHFRALPELLRYVIEQTEIDIGARIALNNFNVLCIKEPKSLDQSEAIYGFAAMLSQINPPIKIGEGCDSAEVAALAKIFCDKNRFSTPTAGFGARLNMPTEEDLLGRFE